MRFIVTRTRHIAAVLLTLALLAALYFGLVFDPRQLNLTTAGICFLVGGGVVCAAVAAFACYTDAEFLVKLVVTCIAACAALTALVVITDTFGKPMSYFKPSYTQAEFTQDDTDSGDYYTDSARLGTGCVIFDAPRDHKAIVSAREVGNECHVTVDIFHYYANAYVVGGVSDAGGFSRDGKTYELVYPSNHQLDLTLYKPEDAANRHVIPESISRVPAFGVASTRYVSQFN